MTDTGLNRRLRQHSRRSGLTVALTMVLATGLMIAVFIGLFAWLNPMLSDFISSADGSRGDTAIGVATPDREQSTEPPASVAPSGPALSGPSAQATTAPPTESAGGFAADYQSNPEAPINLRAEPGTSGTQILEILEPGTPLQSMGQNEVVNGVTWIQFRTADGQVGWIREIDAVQLNQ